MREITVINTSKATVVGSRVMVADSFVTRLVGLMGRRTLEPGRGLLIAPSSGVHTCWMRMKIDIAAIDKNHQVVKLAKSVKPWRISCLSLKASSILELPAGHIEFCGLKVGDQLELQGLKT